MKTNSVEIAITQILPDFPEIKLVYLFGSQVKGKIGPMSDYDLALFVDSQADLFEIQARVMHVMVVRLETERVDVVLLNSAPIELAHHVIAEGEVIYQLDNMTRVEYEARVMGLYGDYLPILRAQRTDILKGDNDAYRIQWYRTALGRTERTLGQTSAISGKTAL